MPELSRLYSWSWVKVTVLLKANYYDNYRYLSVVCFFGTRNQLFFFIFFCLKGGKKNGRRAFRCRLSGVIKTDAVGPLLSDTSHRIRIFMALYLNPFCWHKHAAQRWASPTWRFFCRSLPLNLPPRLRKWHFFFFFPFFWCSVQLCGPDTGKSGCLMVARRSAVTRGLFPLMPETAAFAHIPLTSFFGMAVDKHGGFELTHVPSLGGEGGAAVEMLNASSSHLNNKEQTSHSKPPTHLNTDIYISSWPQTPRYRHVSQKHANLMLNS